MKMYCFFKIVLSGLLLLGAGIPRAEAGLLDFLKKETPSAPQKVDIKESVAVEEPAEEGVPSGKVRKSFLGEISVQKSAKEKGDALEKKGDVLSNQPRTIDIGPIAHTYLIPPLGPVYHFVTPFSGIPTTTESGPAAFGEIENGWVEMANISDENANVIVKIYNRAGELQMAQSTRILPHGYARTREMFGDRDISDIADPAVVEVKSSAPLCVMSCRQNPYISGSRRDRSGCQGWGFDVWPAYLLQRSMILPVSGLNNAKLEFANPWDEPVTLFSFAVSRGEESVFDQMTDHEPEMWFITIPPKGYISTTDEELVGTDLYDLGSPLQVSFVTERPLAVNLARWSEDVGCGVTPSFYYKKASFPCGGRYRWDGRMECIFFRHSRLPEDIYHPVRLEFRNRDGVLVYEGTTSVTASRRTAYISGSDFLARDSISGIRCPGTASLAAVIPAGVDVSNLLSSPCALRNYDSFKCCSFAVTGDELFSQNWELIVGPLSDVGYEFPVNGFDTVAVEFTNVGETDSLITFRIYNENGEFQGLWTAGLAPNAYLSTEDAVWRIGGVGGTGPIDIYGIAKPCVVRITSSGGRIKIVHTRWSHWGAVGFSPLPISMLEMPTLRRIGDVEPVGTGFMGTVGGEE